ncbi:MAG: tetratricopeptide repeat protein [Acidobacteria bacterium]|nr:tetratricopeptide repeat protein [Acidobacteriota bacterium]
MPGWLSRSIGLFFIGLLLVAGGAHHSPVQSQSQSAAYDFQNPTQREMRGGETHTYTFKLKANELMRLVIEQRGIDVVLRWLGPDGTVLDEVDSPTGIQGPETLITFADQAGTYHLNVVSPNQAAAAGSYELKVEEFEAASQQGRFRYEATKLNNQLTHLFQAGKYDEALQLAPQAIEECEKFLGADHYTVGDSLNTLAELYRIKSDYAKAEPLYQRSLLIMEKSLGPDHPNVAKTMNNLAVLYQARGDFLRAEALYQQSLGIYEKALGPDHTWVASILNSLAVLYRTRGDYDRPELLYQRCLAIKEKALGPDHPEIAIALSNWAYFYYFKGDFVKAEPFFQRSLAISEKVFGPDHPDVAASLNGLALVFRAKGDYAQAESLARRSLVIREKALGRDHPEVAQSLNNLALIVTARGETSTVEPLFQRAVEIYTKTQGPHSTTVASSLANLAQFYETKDDYATAEPLLKRTLEIREKAFGPNHPAVAEALFHLAALYQAKGDISQAILYQSRSNEVSERDLMRNLVSGSERQKLLYLNQTATITERTLSLNMQAAPQNLEARQVALTVLLRRKGRALDALTQAIETLRQKQDPETQNLLDDYARLTSQISVLTLRGPGKQKPEDHLAYLQSLEEQKEKLEAAISRRSKEFQAQTIPVTLEGVQKLIPAQAVLLEYAVYRPYDTKVNRFGPARYVVYSLDQQGKINVADLGEVQHIDESVAKLRQLLSNSRSDLENELKPAAQDLNQLVLKPIRSLIGNARQLLISPDGGLSLIPFAALVDETGSFLLEQYQLTYLTSGRDLLRLAVKVESHHSPVILADPDYSTGKGPVLAGKQYKPLSRLIGTKVEGQSLKSLFPKADLKMQAQASKPALKEVKRPEILHIATHGRFLEDKPQPQLPQMAQRSLVPVEPQGNAEQLKLENPLLRSWLFFAGANCSDAGETDSTLTALEAAQLDLWGTKLVVLSACETGVGEAKTGDGVYGLRRALVLAGSESQMMSLWSVSDRATGELMVEYYTRLKAGEGRGDALRNVQLKMLNDPKRRHPFYWASFIQSGEWANLAGVRKK